MNFFHNGFFLTFTNSNEYQIFKKIIALEYEFPSGFPEVPKSLVEALLVNITCVVYFLMFPVSSPFIVVVRFLSVLYHYLVNTVLLLG